MNQSNAQLANASVAKALAVVESNLGSAAKAKFDASRTSLLDFGNERHYFMQLLKRNPMLAEAVVTSPDSAVVAMIDLGAMGLSLSPALGQAYLVPERDRVGAPLEVHCIPSYKGLETAVLRAGNVTSIVTELVYSNDVFKRGVTMDGPFLTFEMATGNRGDLIGGFCLSKLQNGDRNVEWMSAVEINACEAAATSRAGGKTPPAWRGPFAGELRKKCVVRRAAKHWALMNVVEVALHAVDREIGAFDDDYDATHDGAAAGTAVLLCGDAEIKAIRDALPELAPTTQDLWMKRKAEALGFASIRDVPADRLESIITDLRQRLENILAAKSDAKQAADAPAPAQEAPSEAPDETQATAPPTANEAPAAAPEPVTVEAIAKAQVSAARRKRVHAR